MTKINEEHGLISSVHKLRRTNHKDFQNCLFACFLSQNEPKKVIQALEDPNWVEAMQDELLQFKLLKVYTLVDLPRDKWAIGTKWIFRNKKDERGIVVKNKARLVAHGFKRMLIFRGGIISTANISVSTASAIPEVSTTGVSLAEAELSTVIPEVSTAAENLVYIRRSAEKRKDKEKAIIKEYESVNKEERQWIARDAEIAKQLQEEIDTARQEQEKSNLEKAFELQKHTPIETNKDLVKNEEAIAVEVHLYRSMIGSLMYLTASRPDIMFAVCACSRFAHLIGSFLDSDYAGASLDRKSTTGGKSKEAGTLRYLSLVVPLKKVGDEVVHKELGDKMERAATIASSLEVEQDSSGPRCEDNTFRSGEDSMLLIELMAHYTKLYALYALTENPTIYTSLIQQFGETASISTSENEEIEITAIIDGRVKTVTYESIRRHLKLEDAMEEPATMPYDSSQPRVQSLGSDEGSLILNELTVLCTTLSKKVEDLRNDLKQTKLTYCAAYTKLILRVKKLEHKDEGTSWIQEDADIQGKNISTASAIPKCTSEGVQKREKDQGKAIMKEDESVQTKTKKQLEQERLSHEEAIRLKEQINEEERQRIARDTEIAKQLQEEINTARQEQEKSDLEKALELQKYHAQQNRSFSKAEVRKNMCIYLKNQEEYKHIHFKGMSYEGIRPIFERVWDQNKSFVPKDSEIEKEVMKRSGFDFQKPPAKRQKDWRSFRKKCTLKLYRSNIQILTGKFSLTESEVWKNYKALGNHTEVYQVFEDILKRFDKDDLEKL
ncbi:ribonuclease H-like domain-containing protein [Tanacetum coccineum]|uniref:Ribonuclease H-like domain-containing protein n=1 Tax=Tanacetum coccineum TaxID=301880 RepID=A0ABQ5IXE0_9ASTR